MPSKAAKRAYDRREWDDPIKRRLRVNKKYLRLYGVTYDERETMIAAQGGNCMICGGYFGASLHLDHSHSAGHVRGMLCCNCNRGLGMFNDDPARLESAVAYLRRA